MSSRKNEPFVTINCAALPEQLLESELFGYEEGAFTGAKRGGKTGLFDLANTGTIFLDEIGDISKSLQVRLLRVIESKEVMRLGGDKYVSVDIRILSASHKDLRVEVAMNRFRADLYYRLSILKLSIPPLRERLQDIPEIIESLLTKHHKPTSTISKRMYKRMHRYPWHGNIRELFSFIESYLILLDKKPRDEPLFMELMEELDMTGMKEMVCLADTTKMPGEAEMPAIVPGGDFCAKLKGMVEAYEYKVIENTLKTCKFNRAEAAQQLGISANTLWRKYNQKTSTRES
jgi:propionate catabolism operon transcriptional regulator